jgi:hypothetical protein
MSSVVVYRKLLPNKEKAVEASGGEECSRLALAQAQAAFGKRAEAERTLTELKANSKRLLKNHCQSTVAVW